MDVGFDVLEAFFELREAAADAAGDFEKTTTKNHTRVDTWSRSTKQLGLVDHWGNISYYIIDIYLLFEIFDQTR